uniref:CP29 n=2 Tax=Dunaliella salina TaxID=3046 RepID=UPI0021506BBE|nr:Chain R, CP29 [Dunaliella salina]7PI5_r Chain r, CP29 [Dunaliella salina]7PIW_R Chain R, CP29 [Dunaliella salina]7PIW_r Chain r, CP29 [Dunaliella salina]
SLSYLDGHLPGDMGFDPLHLSSPTVSLQIGVDEEDQNQAQNKKGDVEAIFRPEVFGLARFRETEVIHGRWAMLGTLGAIVGEAATGVSWVDAGKVELDGAQYLGQSLPFSISQLIWIEAILVGGVEVLRNNELDLEKRIYPGGAFDPLNLADEEDEEKSFRLKTAEIKHGRLAMVAFLGFGIQAAATGEGALGSLAKFTSSL